MREPEKRPLRMLVAAALFTVLLLPPGAFPQQSTQDQPDQTSQQPAPKNSKNDVNKIGDRNVGKGVNFYSLEREIALGKQLAQEVERSSKLVDDPIVTDYVNRVGQNLVRNSDARVPFTIKVLDRDEINARELYLLLEGIEVVRQRARYERPDVVTR